MVAPQIMLIRKTPLRNLQATKINQAVQPRKIILTRETQAITMTPATVVVHDKTTITTMATVAITTGVVAIMIDARAADTAIIETTIDMVVAMATTVATITIMATDARVVDTTTITIVIVTVNMAASTTVETTMVSSAATSRSTRSLTRRPLIPTQTIDYITRTTQSSSVK